MTLVKTFEHLPKNIVPIHYNLSFQPDLKKLTFKGDASIDIQVTVEIYEIILNSVDLTLSEVVFQDAENNSHYASEIKYQLAEEIAIIKFSKPLVPQNGRLMLKFEGELNENMRGFYRTKYNSLNGSECFAAITHFQATHARRAFPCWDEPSIKSTFDISLIVPNDRVALSNMNVISDIPIKGELLRLVKFATTPIMSTYLIAFVVGEFDFVEGMSSDGVKVRVYTPLGKKEQGTFALQVAVKTLPYYKEFFDVAYPLPKLDLIAVAELAFGAMENWGLVTYRETCLLVDPLNTSTLNKQWVALVVGHELAHMWFGNLVTMEWWTHLWLNEGFASFVQFLCVHEIFPHFDVWTQFVTDQLISGLELDALKNSHPIEVTVGHPDEVNEIFDDISYRKGASIIRMLYNFIKDDCFRKGMNIYLTRHAYKNTSTEDLWKALEEASNKPVGAVMSTWTKQKGFPAISVSSKQDGKNVILSLTQEKFNVDSLNKGENDLWMVPISISTAADPQKIAKEILFKSKSTEVILENVHGNQWVKLNPGAVGFYRIQYTNEMMAHFIKSIKDKTLPPIDRLILQDDLFAMVQSAKVHTVDILKLMQAYKMEDNYSVWCSIASCLATIDNLLSHTRFQGLFHLYCKDLLSEIYNKIGWDSMPGESHTDSLLRALVISRLCAAKDEQVLKEVKNRFEAHVNGTKVIDADLRGPIYRAAVGSDDGKTFDAMMKLYRETDLMEEKNRIARALGAVLDKDHIRSILEFSLSSEVRIQDSTSVIISVSLTQPGRDLAWSFFKENKDELCKRYKGIFLNSRLVKGITENFASEDKAKEIEDYFRENSFPGTERALKQSLETIRLNARWLARDQPGIEAFLKNNS